MSITHFFAQAIPTPTSGINQIFGTVAPPGPRALTDPGTGFSKLLTSGIQLAIFVAGLLLLGYLMYGAFLYITSGGEEENTLKARNTMMYAVIGIIMLFIGLAIFGVVAGNILGIIKFGPGGGFIFDLPTVSSCLQSGAVSSVASDCCSNATTFNGLRQVVCQ